VILNLATLWRLLMRRCRPQQRSKSQHIHGTLTRLLFLGLTKTAMAMENPTATPPPEKDPEKVLQQVVAEILKDIPSSTEGRIGGWLFLPLTGLFVMLSLRIESIIKMLPSFSPENWNALTSPASPGYHWAWAPVMVSGMAADIILLVLGIVLIILFLRKKKTLPMLITAYYLLDVISLVCCTLGIAVIGMKQVEMSKLFSPENCRQILNGSIWAMIWIPYFIKSKRVKRTFVNA
jgi:hypothetical protein